jgi:hypothetical protein
MDNQVIEIDGMKLPAKRKANVTFNINVTDLKEKLTNYFEAQTYLSAAAKTVIVEKFDAAIANGSDAEDAFISLVDTYGNTTEPESVMYIQ